MNFNMMFAVRSCCMLYVIIENVRSRIIHHIIIGTYYIQYGYPVTLYNIYTYSYYVYKVSWHKCTSKSASQQMRSQRDAEVRVHNIIIYSIPRVVSYTHYYICTYIATRVLRDVFSNYIVLFLHVPCILHTLLGPKHANCRRQVPYYCIVYTHQYNAKR